MNGIDLAREAVAFVVGFVAALLGAYSYALWQSWSRRPHLTHALKLTPRRDVVICYPPRDPPVPEPVLPGISTEDFMATYNLQRLLVSGGWNPNRIRMKDMRRCCDDPQDQHQNLVLLCAPWRNTMTQEAFKGLAELLKKHAISMRQSRNGARCIRFRGGEWWGSKQQQVAPPAQGGRAPSEGPLEDYALIVAASRDEWAGHGPVVVVCGLRGVGTWGAANHLRRTAKRLETRVGRKGFAMVVGVKYAKWDIVETDELNFVAFE